MNTTTNNDQELIVPLTNKDDVCPVCKTDRYLNPKLLLLVGTCFHKMYFN